MRFQFEQLKPPLPKIEQLFRALRICALHMMLRLVPLHTGPQQGHLFPDEARKPPAQQQGGKQAISMMMAQTKASSTAKVTSMGNAIAIRWSDTVHILPAHIVNEPSALAQLSPPTAVARLVEFV
jgi:hypothetical protein